MREADGKEIPLLTPKEREALSIRSGILTQLEELQMRSIASHTESLLQNIPFTGAYGQVPFWARSCHESLDGSGYPKGLREKELPFEVRLMAILDQFASLTAGDHPQQTPASPEEAFKRLRELCDAGKLDRDILESFVKSGAWKEAGRQEETQKEKQEEIQEQTPSRGKNQAESRNWIVGKPYPPEQMIALAIALTREERLHALLDRILMEAMDYTHCDGGTIYVQREDQLVFQILSTRSKGGHLIRKGNEPLLLPSVPLDKKHVCSCAALEQKRIRIDDIYQSKEYDFSGTKDYDQLNGYRSQSMLVLPMEDEQGRTIGVIQLINALDEKGNVIPFDEGMESIVMAMASLAAVRYNNTLLQRSLQRMFEGARCPTHNSDKPVIKIVQLGRQVPSKPLFPQGFSTYQVSSGSSSGSTSSPYQMSSFIFWL